MFVKSLQEQNNNSKMTSPGSLSLKNQIRLKASHSNSKIFHISNALNQSQSPLRSNFQKKTIFSILPHPISFQLKTTKISVEKREKQRMLKEETLSHITASRWVVFDLNSKKVVKGYKYRKQHELGNLTSLLVFYCVDSLVQKYFLSFDKFELFVSLQDSKKSKGTLPHESIISLLDALYMMLLENSTLAAEIIMNNFGSFLLQKQQSRYFSCYDLGQSNRELNICTFLQVMRNYASDLKLTETQLQDVEHSRKNQGSAFDLAILSWHCLKISLFRKIISQAVFEINVKYISSKGQLINKIESIKNCNRVFGSSCLGGKSGSHDGVHSAVQYFEEDILVVVLGCAGKEEKFSDCERLIRWFRKGI